MAKGVRVANRVVIGRLAPTVAACFLAVILFAIPGSAQLPPQAQPILREVVLDGISVFGRGQVLRWLRLEVGAPLPEPSAALANDLERRYQREGYTAARVTGDFDEANGSLTLKADEGRIDAIEFTGIDEELARRFAGEFEIQPGDVFNRRDVSSALDRLLKQTRGAVRAVSRALPGSVFSDSHDVSREARAFGLVDRDGRRVLAVNLGERNGRFSLAMGSDGREDWFSPVDGFAPALGFSAAAFDHKHFNHTFLGGYASYTFAPARWGYSFGFDRPLFEWPKLFIGAGLYDLTASDDRWRLSPTEQSLVAAGFRDTFRDYYRRRGYQVTAALRPHPQHELLAAWRDEREETLQNESDFSLWGGDDPYRSNAPIQDGRLRSVIVGYAWDSRGFERESLRATYLRHQMDDFCGSGGSQEPGWRVEWTSEISASGLASDFLFRRDILNARRYTRLSPRQSLNARLLAGLSDDRLPPQRQFALGGVGSVRGYEFKQEAGERMILANVEYRLALTHGLAGLAFFDAGRVFHPVPGSADQWMKGVGLGVGFDDLRIEFGWRTDEIPGSLHVLVRLQPTF